MDSHLADVWFRVTDLEVATAAGAVVTAIDGTDYLDFTSGIGVTNTGHCHPRVVEAIRQQAGSFMHAQINIYRHPIVEQLGARLAEVTPDGVDCFFVTNSGAEAVEASVKLARQATGRPHIVVFQGGFHGRTAQTMAMTTAKAGYRVGHAPQPAGVFVAPFPGWGLGGDSERCLAELDLMLHTQTAPSEVAAMVIEPVLGEGGYLPAPAEFLQGLEARCRANGILLVADEIQTGFGRTGAMFAVERAGVTPDILVMAKGMASGFPIAAVGSSSEIMSRWPQGSHGGTYGGNPMGCAAALATIDVIEDEGLVARSATLGATLIGRLRDLQDEDASLGDVRGVGLMVGCELVDGDGQPDKARADAIVAHCRTEGRLLLMTCGPDANTVRWIPPLVISDEQLETAIESFAKALAATA